jgi:hypothetical protein
MENKKLYIGLGVLAVAGIGYYMCKKNKPEEQKSNITSCRKGTCPFTRADGSIFCTSAACPKTDRNSTSI